MSGIVLNLFAGPGGWCVAADALGLERNVGLELDSAACATRWAAGHHTIRCDVACFDVSRLAGIVRAIAGSPPCTTFSAAGKRAGNELTDVLAALIRDAFAGRPTRARRRREMAALLRASMWPGPKLTRAQRSAKIWPAVRSASLVAEPARFIAAANPEWVALEQVPSVLPLWEVYAEELRKRGYSAWCGLLNAADYGVPQTRVRAILIASRVRKVSRPAPTHYDPRKGMQLFGSPWISMADALGIGMTERPAPALTAGGTAAGGAEPFPTRARDLMAAEREAGRWVLRTSYGTPKDGDRNGTHEMDPAARPAHAVTTKAGSWALRVDAQANATVRDVTAPAPAPALKFGHSAAEMQWVLRRNRAASADRRDHPMDEPAPTITSAGSKAGANLEWVCDPNASGNRADYRRPVTQPSPSLTGQVQFWKLRNNSNDNACSRGLDQPAGTIFFSHRMNDVSWIRERPATTVLGEPRMGRPGHKGREPGGESHFAVDSVRITPQEAAVLQSFPWDYPWKGTKTKIYEQIGNAFPPLAALHVLSMATGISLPEWLERAA